MKTQIELINYYTNNMNKVVKTHGVDSDYTNYAFYLLQAVKMNIPQKDIFSWANNKVEELKKEALNYV